jgi:hypothetical protein
VRTIDPGAITWTPRSAQLGHLVGALCDEFGASAVCAAAVNELRARREAAGADPRTGEPLPVPA